MSAPTTRLDIKASARLSGKFLLLDIGFVALEGRQKIAPSKSDPALAFEYEDVHAQWALQDQRLSAVLAHRVRLQEVVDNEARSELATIFIAVRLAYESRELLAQADIDAIPNFVGISAGMHAWPYVRAEVQALSIKLGYPALTLPLRQAETFMGIAPKKMSLPPERQEGSESAEKRPEQIESGLGSG